MYSWIRGFLRFGHPRSIGDVHPSALASPAEGISRNGLLASRYVFGFEDRWIQAGGSEASELLGTSDIQSMADITNVYSNVRQMRLVPFGTDDITRLAATPAAPLLPLAADDLFGPAIGKISD